MRIKNIRTKNMKAKKRVINSRHETVGFIVTKVFEDGSYRDIFRNKARIMHDIKKKRISNLKLTSNSVIRETRNKKLDTLTLKKWNEDRYNEILNKNILERDIQEKLNNWKEKSKHNVLQLQGCRQIGKTTELLKFGYNKYENLIYVDMANDVFNFKDISKSGNKEIFMIKYCIKSNLPKFDNSKNTLIIIDEIQLSVEVYNSIRQMNRNLHCDIIVTGSYLGYTLNKEFFKPAGDIEFMSMYSLSFEEFCNAFNLKNKLTNINLFGKSDKKDYEQIFEKYELYKKIGGYPSVIMIYKKNNKNIQLCLKEIHNLVEVFKRESQMYFNNNEECLIFEDIYKSVLRSMCKNKKGSGSKLLSELDKYILDSGKKALVSRKEINKAIAWLVNSDIVGVCDLYDPVSREIFNSRKLYFMDCGIAYYMYIITEGIDKSNVDGILSENFAYCEFKKICDTDDRVINTNPYFMTYNNYELDFVMISSKKNKYGIEIKTNKGDDKSLKVIMQKNMLDYGVLAEKTQGGNSNFSSTKTITIPVFAVGARFPYGLE